RSLLPHDDGDARGFECRLEHVGRQGVHYGDHLPVAVPGTRLGHPGSAKSESTYTRGSKGSRSPACSPVPISLTGTPNCCSIPKMTPPRELPSSLVITRPGSDRASWKTRACWIEFWPMAAARTSNV